MAVTTAVTILVFCCTAASVVSQEVGCSSLNSPYVWSNLGNLSVGISDIQQLRDLALQPLLAQPRIPGTAGSRLARTHIKTWMSAAGWTVEEDSFYDAVPWPYGTRFFSNVIATLNPDRSRRVVLACHYDTKILPGARFVGAIDSAVPCALLLDSAVRLSDVFRTARDSVSDLTVQFIFFDGEEALVSWSAQDSLYGARHLANNWASKPDPNSQGLSYLQSIETFILLDLIGTPDTEFKLRFRETASVYSKLLNIERCLKTRGHLKPTQNTNPIFNSQEDHHAVDDDHAPFYNRGVPVVHLITYPFSPVWHTPADDLSALDFDRIENLARILRVFLADLPL